MVLEEKNKAIFDEESIKYICENMLSDTYVSRLSSFFKVIGDESRVKIIYALSLREMCVNDIAEALGMTQSAVSHQLKLMKAEGHVKARRSGKNMFYSLDDEHVVDIMEEGLKHIVHKFHEHE